MLNASPSWQVGNGVVDLRHGLPTHAPTSTHTQTRSPTRTHQEAQVVLCQAAERLDVTAHRAVKHLQRVGERGWRKTWQGRRHVPVQACLLASLSTHAAPPSLLAHAHAHRAPAASSPAA